MADLDEILTGKAPEPETMPETPAEPEVQAEPEAAEVTPEPKVEEPKDVEPKDIPYAVFKSTRDDLKSQIDEMKREMAQARQPKPEPVKAPDLYEDPEGYQRFHSEQLNRVRMSTIADMSEVMAIEAHGQEVVEAAFEAAKAAGEAGRFINSRHPYGDMVKWHKQQQVIKEIGDDPAAYREKTRAEIRAEIEAEIVAKQAQAIAGKAPPSMAGINGSGGQRDPGWAGPTPLNKLIG